MSREVVIRRMKAQERGKVISITWKTGLFGEDLTGRHIVPDKLLFSYLYSWYYITYEPENCFVAVVDGEVAGYLIGTSDTRIQRRRFQASIIPKINKRVLKLQKYGILYDQKAKDWLSGTLHDEILSYQEQLPAMIEEYPAHLHINVLPGYQRLGIGHALMDRFIETMSVADARGIHLITTSINSKAVPFYKKRGFKVLSEQSFDARWVGHEEASVLVFGMHLDR